MTNERIEKRKILNSSTLFDALKKMDENYFRLLLVVDNQNCFEGLLSLGDIQRAIIKKIQLETPINQILRKEIQVSSVRDSIDYIKHRILKYRMEFIPVIDDKEIINVYFWEDFFGEKKYDSINLPVVIMAGGLGTRMRPLTNIIPKPLIPVGNKPIIHEIIERFERFGCSKFLVSVNYKHEMIQNYLAEANIDSSISLIKEDMATGTAGSLALMQDYIVEQTIFVTNCDILIGDDYTEIYKYHIENNNDLTIVSAFKHYYIPYGVLETTNDGVLENINEKPRLHMQINTGMYILESKWIDSIPKNEMYHMTHLIGCIKKDGGRIGVFPVSEKSWSDVGEWGEYINTIGRLGHNS